MLVDSQLSVCPSLSMANIVLKMAETERDPLGEWTRWISRVTEMCTNDKRKQLLAHGNRHFRKDERYCNDERYLKLWMSYADLTQDANKVFMWLRSREIGTQLALFWVTWSYILETRDSYGAAAKKLVKGVARGAVPASLLHRCKVEFEERMRERIWVVTTSDSDITKSASFVESCGPIDDGGLGDESSQGQPMVPFEISDTPELLGSDISSVSSKGGTVIPRSVGMHSRANKAKPASVMASKVEGHPQANHQSTECKKQESLRRRRNAHADKRRESQRAPLGAINTNVPPLACQPRFEQVRNHRHRRYPHDRVGINPAGVSIRVIHEPFSLHQRRCMTTDTDEYAHWIATCNIVHSYRHESLPRGWIRKIPEFKLKSRQNIIVQLRLGDHTANVIGLLGVGSFAAVFSCSFPGDEQLVAVKLERQVSPQDTAPSLPWESFIIMQLHQRVREFLPCEQRAHGAVLIEVFDRRPNLLEQYLDASARVLKPSSLFLYRDGCAMIMPQSSSGTLHDLVSAHVKLGQSVPQLVAVYYAREMLKFCRSMHAALILHMDVKPDNWLLITRMGSAKSDSDGVALGEKTHSMSLIDFGRAIDLSILDRNGSEVVFTGCCCASSFKSPAVIEGRQWKYDADLFALGSCIFFMLHGSYLEVQLDRHVGCSNNIPNHGRRWRPTKKCRRYWEVELWDNLFDKLLNVDGQATTTADITNLLDGLISSLTSYLAECPQRSIKLQELLRKQDNMLNNR